MTNSPYLFDEFFAKNREESISPFLTRASRSWGKDLALKRALIAAVFLGVSFALYFVYLPLSHVMLLGTYFLVGTPAFIDALEDLNNLEINIDVLMTFAALLSVVIGSGFEGALLLVLFELSAAMEEMTRQKTQSALVHLHRISPKTALVVEGPDAVVEKAVKDIPVGSKILIKAGEVVPLDGRVIQGYSFVNLVHLTGEAHPISKQVGDEVPAGARNLEGTFTLEVNLSSKNSTLSRLIELVTQASLAKPRLESFLDRFGKFYALGIISLAALFALTLPWMLDIPYLGKEGGIYRALAFLIAASPCALIIATPTAYLSALSSCAKKGALLKGGAILDALANTKTIAFDKTGTLTTGKLICTAITKIHGSTENSMEALSVAAGLEHQALHPVAEAICSYAKKEKTPFASITDFRSVAGFGVSGIYGGKPVSIGRAAFILPQFKGPKEKISLFLKEEQKITTFLLLDAHSLFAFSFTDALRPESKGVIASLKDKFRLVMLTGDHAASARLIAEALGITEVYAELKPEEKLTKVEELFKGGGLTMIGDGINDAPALARATVGISMGQIGSDTAVDASDIVLLQDDLSLLSWLIDKSQKTTRIIRENLALALGVILLATTPALLGAIPLWLAVILHEGGTVLVGLSSLRLLR